ncbi:MAG TPA: hypothetical protein VM618_01820 [Acidimicrobiia bacterium]|nr:hypothetical protein [Acidimicrobiia bacterium]
MRKAILAVGVAVVALAATPACSDDGGGGGGGENLSSEEWARAVCEAGLQLADDLRPAVEQVEAAEGDLGDTQDLDAIVSGLNEMEAAMRTMASGFADFTDEIDDLGAPDVEGGEEFQQDLVRSLRSAEPAFEQAVDLLSEFDEDTTLQDLSRLQQEGEKLEEAFSSVGTPFESLDEAPGDLGEQFDEVSECQEAEQRFEELG